MTDQKPESAITVHEITYDQAIQAARTSDLATLQSFMKKSLGPADPQEVAENLGADKVESFLHYHDEWRSFYKKALI